MSDHKGKRGRKPTTHGVGHTGIAEIVYATIIRMYAEGHKGRAIQRYCGERWADYGPDGENALTLNRLNSLRVKRAPEISELREKLMSNLDDLWMAQPRQRVVALQRIFADANRWVPKRAIALELTPEQQLARALDPEQIGRRLTEAEIALREAPTQMIVYEKDTGSMLAALKGARDEIGVDTGSRVADSLESLVERMEGERNLDRTTVDVEVEVAGSVPTLLQGELVEVPDLYPSAGDDEKRGILDGSALPSEASPAGVRGLEDS